ncbi:cadherin-like domain-containing protein [Rhodanobacter sp. C03]|uniref:Ig-like domain-containing protein n=1 Tax=Rhodanobacter sp. C03 TaxID=1945858 RepID=UPI0011158144|nr:cadherin-like domain-containing protein [Rhodanobacter sp. C03]
MLDPAAECRRIFLICEKEPSIQGGGIVYTTPGDYSGNVTFRHTVSDGDGDATTASVTITVKR